MTLRYFQLRLSLKINIKPVCKKCYVGQPTSPFGANHCTERKPNKASRLCASNLRTKKRCDGLQHSGRRNLPVLGLFDHDVSGSCPALWWSLCQPRFHLLAKKVLVIIGQSSARSTHEFVCSFVCLVASNFTKASAFAFGEYAAVGIRQLDTTTWTTRLWLCRDIRNWNPKL